VTTSNRLAITEFATGSDGVPVGNEAIAKLEAGAGRWSCNQVNLNTPPSSTDEPVEGDLYIVGTSATGAWVGQERKKAVFYNDEWLFVPPIEGDLAYDQSTNDDYQYNGTNWVLWVTGGGGAHALDDHTDVDAASPTDGQVMRYDSTSPAAWVNESVATASETRSAADKVLNAAAMESASALVTLTFETDGIAVDWDAFITAEVELSDDTTLENPTNGQPGTWRTVIITQDGTGSWTLAFGTQYEFAAQTAPTLTTAAGSVDVLAILCVTTSLFYVFVAQDMG